MNSFRLAWLPTSIMAALLVSSATLRATAAEDKIEGVDEGRSEGSETFKDKASDALRKTGQGIKKASEEVKEALDASARRRGESTVIGLVDYSLYDLLIPSKIGATVGWIPSAQSTYELEYLRGSAKLPVVLEHLGSMTDTRISLLKRSYGARARGSFNFHYGVSYFMFDMKIGNDILSRASAGQISDYDVVSIHSVGLVAGLGNRWTFNRGITLSVDWFSWAQPLFVTKRDVRVLDYISNSNDRSNVDGATKVIAYFPRFTFLKFQLGMSF